MKQFQREREQEIRHMHRRVDPTSPEDAPVTASPPIRPTGPRSAGSGLSKEDGSLRYRTLRPGDLDLGDGVDVNKVRARDAVMPGLRGNSCWMDVILKLLQLMRAGSLQLDHVPVTVPPRYPNSLELFRQELGLDRVWVVVRFLVDATFPWHEPEFLSGVRDGLRALLTGRPGIVGGQSAELDKGWAAMVRGEPVCCTTARLCTICHTCLEVVELETAQLHNGSERLDSEGDAILSGATLAERVTGSFPTAEMYGRAVFADFYVGEGTADRSTWDHCASDACSGADNRLVRALVLQDRLPPFLYVPTSGADENCGEGWDAVVGAQSFYMPYRTGPSAEQHHARVQVAGVVAHITAKYEACFHYYILWDYSCSPAADPTRIEEWIVADNWSRGNPDHKDVVWESREEAQARLRRNDVVIAAVIYKVWQQGLSDEDITGGLQAEGAE